MAEKKERKKKEKIVFKSVEKAMEEITPLMEEIQEDYAKYQERKTKAALKRVRKNIGSIKKFSTPLRHAIGAELKGK